MNQMPRGAYSSQQGMQEQIPEGYNQYALNQYTPEQQRLFQQVFEHVGPDSYLSRLAMGDQGTIDEMERPALRQFGELQGGIASRFSAAGLGGRRSSGFQNTMTAASQDFAGQLQSKRQELRRQALNDLMGISNTLLNQRPQEKGLQEQPKSFLHEAGVAAAGGFGEGAGKAAAGFFA